MHHKDVSTENSEETSEELDNIIQQMNLIDDVEKKAYYKKQGIS